MYRLESHRKRHYHQFRFYGLGSGHMGQTRSSSYEGLTFGFMIVAFAVSILVAWMMEDWWLVIPLMLILAGGWWTILGFMMRPGPLGGRSGGAVSYFVFWGGTLVLLGAIWFLSDAYPGNAVVWIVLLLIWVGAMAFGLSYGRLRKQGPQS